MTSTPTITRTPTQTATPTATSTLAPGPNITYFGLARADNTLVAPAGETAEGITIYERPFGAGFLVVVEARAGLGGAALGRCNTSYNANDPGARPDIQILASRDLGAGDPAVCDAPLPARQTLGASCGEAPPAVESDGGIPAIEPPNYDLASQAVADAINDFGCRMAYNSVDSPCTLSSFGNPRYASPQSQGQFCTEGVLSAGDVIFPSGDTVLTARWRDSANVLGPPRQIIVRIP